MSGDVALDPRCIRRRGRLDSCGLTALYTATARGYSSRTSWPTQLVESFFWYLGSPFYFGISDW